MGETAGTNPRRVSGPLSDRQTFHGPPTRPEWVLSTPPGRKPVATNVEEARRRGIPKGPASEATLDMPLTPRRLNRRQRGDTPGHVLSRARGASRYVVIVDTQTDVARVTPKVIPDRHLRSKCR